jgi:glycine/D-amino acid oxidase-like deaminating enzyme
MVRNTHARLDVVIFGGGAAGLWLLDDLVRAGYQALLLEADALGAGQTVASQGIIHGGLKYTLGGLLTPSARAIRDMPTLWRRCLAGEREPDLSATRRRAEFCYLWQTRAVTSRLAMIGARAGLRVPPAPLPDDARPEALRGCPGLVARLDEQVIDPVSFIGDLHDHHLERILRIDVENGLEIETVGPGACELVRLINPETGDPLDLRPDRVVLTAGAGNDGLRRRLGLEGGAMQRRPLHMVVARGPLPPINGHCVDGMSTRATITTAHDYADRVVWQIGGQVAEQGVDRDPAALIASTQDVLHEVLPGVALAGVEWATYCVDRAEATTRGGLRPTDAALKRDGNTITGWPTKLALVPRLTARIRRLLSNPRGHDGPAPGMLGDWPRPAVASPPWEENLPWSTDG